jgi:hypothetical protein
MHVFLSTGVCVVCYKYNVNDTTIQCMTYIQHDMISIEIYHYHRIMHTHLHTQTYIYCYVWSMVTADCPLKSQVTSTHTTSTIHLSMYHPPFTAGCYVVVPCKAVSNQIESVWPPPCAWAPWDRQGGDWGLAIATLCMHITDIYTSMYINIHTVWYNNNNTQQTDVMQHHMQATYHIIISSQV